MTLSEPRGDPRHRLGSLGEEAAARALRKAGLKILERRFRVRAGEIDLIAKLGELIVFVEVKTRRGTDFGYPAEAVTATKRRRLARVALHYLTRHGWLDRPSRFDVVEVIAGGDEVRSVRHFEDAFRP